MNLKKILFSLVMGLFILFPLSVKASSGTLVISGSSTVLVGNTLTVNVTLSSSSPLGSWTFDVNYDKDYLKLTSSNAENNGTYFVNAGNGSSKTKTYTLKFQTLKSGSTTISIGGYDVYAYDTSEMTITKTNKKVTIMTQQQLEDSYSKDNNLKSLEVSVGDQVYELDKAFAKDVLEYQTTLPTGTTKAVIKAVANDNTATVNGIGEVDLTEGSNLIPIIVTAQNGDTKTYNLTINVEDQNPISVKVDNIDYVVVKTASLISAPPTFSETTIKINDFDIPAFVNGAANITLVGLKDSKGDIALFIYENNKYTKYQEMNIKSLILLPQDMSEEMDLIKTTVKINGQDYTGYKYAEDSDFVIINAKNLEDGKTALYLYDTKNNTAQKYDASFVETMNKTLKNYTYVIITFGSLLIVMMIIIFGLLHSLHKKQKKLKKFLQKQEAKLEATRKLNDVVKEVQKITKEDNPKIDDNKTDKEKKKEPEVKNNQKPKKEVKEIPKKEEVKINEVEEDSEEVYDIFADDRKLRKKKK